MSGRWVPPTIVAEEEKGVGENVQSLDVRLELPVWDGVGRFFKVPKGVVFEIWAGFDRLGEVH